MTIMEMTGLSAGLFVNFEAADINPIYFILMINFAMAWILCWLWHRYLYKDWVFGLQKQGILAGLKQYGLPVSGGKIEITDRIACFLETGEIQVASKVKKVMTEKLLKKPLQLIIKSLKIRKKERQKLISGLSITPISELFLRTTEGKRS